ncbi:MAG: hypothetical protein EAZ15_07920 [Sphingobacteriales bacterium]|nr:MAG: hypothetical protein EAZ15_07920 [Sphingobacteriales bacterium]
MRKISNLLGYFTALLITLTAIIKLQDLPGAKISLTLSGVLMSIYLFFYIVTTLSEKNNHHNKLTHYLLASAACWLNLGITASYLHFHFANNIILVGVVIFSLLYAPLLFIEKIKVKESNKIMLGSGIFGMAGFVLGLLFTIKHLSGAKFLLIFSFCLAFFIHFPIYITDKFITPDKKNAYIHTAFFYIITGVMLAFYICLTMLSIKIYLY